MISLILFIPRLCFALGCVVIIVVAAPILAVMGPSELRDS